MNVRGLRTTCFLMTSLKRTAGKPSSYWATGYGFCQSIIPHSHVSQPWYTASILDHGTMRSLRPKVLRIPQLTSMTWDQQAILGSMETLAVVSSEAELQKGYFDIFCSMTLVVQERWLWTSRGSTKFLSSSDSSAQSCLFVTLVLKKIYGIWHRPMYG